jgi:hypothetical protein
MNKKNVYTCRLCGGSIVTIDIDEGVTPFMIECKANEDCDGVMHSSFYSVDQSLEPEFEWYKPTSFDHYPSEYRKDMIRHVEDGGLDIRRIKNG